MIQVTLVLVMWGFIATAAMASIMQASQALGLSRLSLPFLIGSAVSGNRATATVVGFVIYFIGGWLFAALYFLIFASVGLFTWWFGAIVGAVHGIFLLTCALPYLPFVHPRMASEHSGATRVRALEPPGFMAMNYGYQTPFSALLAQTVYGGILGASVQIMHAMSG